MEDSEKACWVCLAPLREEMMVRYEPADSVLTLYLCPDCAALADDCLE